MKETSANGQIRTILILASGHGTRMQPLTKGKYPKQLVPINGIPKIQYTLQAIPDSVERIFMIIGPLGEKIRDYCGNFYEGKSITYFEQPECDGTAKAVLKVKNHIQNEGLVVINSDDLYVKRDLTVLTQCTWAMLGYSKSELKQSYRIVINNNNFLVDIAPVQDDNEELIICCGAYTIFPEFFDTELARVPGKKNEFGLPQTLLQMVKRQEIQMYVPRATFWLPVNKPEDIVTAEKALTRSVQGHLFL